MKSGDKKLWECLRRESPGSRQLVPAAPRPVSCPFDSRAHPPRMEGRLHTL